MHAKSGISGFHTRRLGLGFGPSRTYTGRIFRAHGIDTGDFPPWAVMMVIESISRLLLIDSSLGVTIGHDELTAFVEEHLRRFEPLDEAGGQPALDAGH